MSGKGQKVLEEALTLPPEERADLAAELIESLDGPEDHERPRVLHARRPIAEGADSV